MKNLEKLLSKNEIGIKTFGSYPISVYVLNYSSSVIDEDDAWEILDLAGYDLQDLEFIEEDLAVAVANNATQAFVFHLH